MEIGERIRQRRLELGMSQDELAKLSGYKSRTSINKIEVNGNGLTQSKIKAIADALRTTPDYIMGWDKEVDSKVIESSLDNMSLPQLRRIQKYLEWLIACEEEQQENDEWHARWNR